MRGRRRCFGALIMRPVFCVEGCFKLNLWGKMYLISNNLSI
jgi:hypothetical protein